jgi:hypothetical protein
MRDHLDRRVALLGDMQSKPMTFQAAKQKKNLERVA